MQDFGPFELSRQLARGGMGEIFLAYRRTDPTKKPLVLKRIRPELVDEQEYAKRLMFEAQVASRLSHPNLVQFLEYGKVGNCPYLAMEHVRGYSLARLLNHAIEHNRPPPLPVPLSIMSGLLSALSAMHEAKDESGAPRPILHRDVTPTNIIVTHKGRPVLIDFGIAKDVLGPAITQIGRVVGTARYMAPEHRKGEFIDARADVFSASVIAYELLTAQCPWPPMPSMRELLRTVFDPPEISDEIRARVPADVLELVLKGLSCDAEDRFRDARDFLDRLSKTESMRELRARSESVRNEALKEWIRESGLPPDEQLEGLVVDNRPAGQPGEQNLVWSPKGEILSAGAIDMRATLPPSTVLTIPPLPPRRETNLEKQEAEIPEPLPPKTPWQGMVSIALLVLIVGLLIALIRLL